MTDSVAQPVAATLVEAVVPDTTTVAENHINLDYNFHLVAGCFQVEENAVKFVQSLQAQNLSAAIIGKNNKGLYVVSCGDFATRKDALSELNALRKVQPNAWLYRN
jgi:cell division protein FtsN